MRAVKADVTLPWADFFPNSLGSGLGAVNWDYWLPGDCFQVTARLRRRPPSSAAWKPCVPDVPLLTPGTPGPAAFWPPPGRGR